MTDKLKIMTDNEIIKAFKDFLIEQVDGYTDHVETGGERYEFIEKELELLKETDNLINRQQAQLFKERNKNSKLRNERNRLKAEVERLKYNLKAVLDERADHSEAYKEFAERLDRKFAFSSDTQCISAKTIRKFIQDELKETESK